MSNYESFQHVFLIAMPQMSDPNFAQSVVYLWEYDEEGATGVIINKPMNVYLKELLKQVNVKEISRYAQNYQLLFGGPVASDQLFIIRRQHHEMHDKDGNPVFEITISSTRQDLVDLATTDWKHEAIVALGCCSWVPGQLDKELANNDWLIAPFSHSTLFGSELKDIRPPSSAEVWYSAAARAGIDLHRLSSDFGHA